MNHIKLLIAAVSLTLAGAANAALSDMKFSTSLKKPEVKVVTLKDIITKVTQKSENKPKVVLVALSNIVKKLPVIKLGHWKGDHGNGHGHGHGHNNPPPYGCGTGGGGWGCGCHASKH